MRARCAAAARAPYASPSASSQHRRGSVRVALPLHRYYYRLLLLRRRRVLLRP